MALMATPGWFMAALRFSDPMTPTPMKAVEMRSLAEVVEAAKAEAAVAAVAERKNARRAMSLVGITEMLSQAEGKQGCPPGKTRLIIGPGGGLGSKVQFGPLLFVIQRPAIRWASTSRERNLVAGMRACPAKVESPNADPGRRMRLWGLAPTLGATAHLRRRWPLSERLASNVQIPVCDGGLSNSG